MIDELAIRRIFREEIDRLIPRLGAPKPQLTIPECIKRYGHSHRFYRDLIARGELEVSVVRHGRNGHQQYFVKTDSAERHPELGGQPNGQVVA